MNRTAEQNETLCTSKQTVGYSCTSIGVVVFWGGDKATSANGMILLAKRAGKGALVGGGTEPQNIATCHVHVHNVHCGRYLYGCRGRVLRVGPLCGEYGGEYNMFPIPSSVRVLIY